MEPILTSILTALVAGATARAKDLASKAITDAYEGLKGMITRKLGKGGAVQSVEDDPGSDAARATLAEAMAKNGLAADSELEALAQRLENVITEAKAKAVPGAGDIDIETVRGKVNTTVKDLVAAGRISFGSVIAETGDVTIEGLRAGVAATGDSRAKND